MPETVAPVPALEAVDTTMPAAQVTRAPAVEAPAGEEPAFRFGSGVFLAEPASEDLHSRPYVIQLASSHEPFPQGELPVGGVYAAHRLYTVPHVKDGKTTYRMRLGFFSSLKEAEQIIEEIWNDYDDAWITISTLDERKMAFAPSGVSREQAIARELTAKGDITLNFDETDLREFIRVVFEDILGENYLIDPQLKGKVTLNTTYPVNIDAVLSIVESVLQINGAALVHDQGVFKIIPLANAESEVVSPMIGSQPVRQMMGFGTQIVPLRHVSAAEIEKILKPFVPKGSSLRVDTLRNLLIISGPRYRLNRMLETVQIFDVDWLEGMSFGIFPLEYADANTIVSDIRKIIGTEGQTPLEGIVRLEPIERLNAILVITHQPKHLNSIRNLIEQFDLGTAGPPGRRLYVYDLRNGKAENIAAVLQEIFGQEASAEEAPVAEGIAELPPGQGRNVFRTARQISEPPPPVGAAGAGGDYPVVTARTAVTPVAETAVRDGEPTETAVPSESQRPVTIMADQDNNAILVLASPDDYRMIEAAIRKLDIAPRQVLINAIIAEVTLNDDLNYGVQWFLSRSNFELGFGAPVPANASGAGLALALFDDDLETQLFFDTLESVSSVKFISAPQVMVRDNQTANIRVGDQIPVTVRTSQSTTDPDAPIVTEVQFRDTGTLLSVSPRINAGGLVTLNISQEVSLPGTEPAVGGGGNVAISQRTIDSSVTVQDGQTVVLGGLIRETETEAKSGIPILMDIPLLGLLFSSTSEVVNRTELIVTVNPTVVEDQLAAEDITEELRLRMRSVSEYQDTTMQRYALPEEGGASQ